MANVSFGEELSPSCKETEELKGEIAQPYEEDVAVAPSFGDGGCLVESAADASSCQEKKMMDDKISPIEGQLQYLLNKADEIQVELVWSSGFQNDRLAGIIPMFLQTCEPYFTYLETTARNNHPFHPPLSIYICTQLLQFSQQLSSRLEQLVLMYASFNVISIEENDPASISHFFIGKCRIDNMKLSIFRYCCPTPFLASANTGLYKRMRWNVEREDEEEYEGNINPDFYFLCCEDVFEDAEAKGDDTSTENQSRMTRLWSIGQWNQTYPDPDDITNWVLCSVPCAQYKQLLCLGNEEPSSCTATDCLLGALLSEETHGTLVSET
ncbi:UPF0575 protein C19orf67 homolog isoform X2 [Triplophysa dalaica]|uniref:UPF0575 protein C19orf67 homolog isoform X2 n=1 Tax=Triplophysa dalaica TaxID=1582913 RepID=UPI0024DF8FF5|nr:UPF0575 protein C19orf67 homolog isoform X2 [Triplophysa dalaica]